MQGQTTSIGETITTDTAQTISGAKTFSAATTFSDDITVAGQAEIGNLSIEDSSTDSVLSSSGEVKVAHSGGTAYKIATTNDLTSLTAHVSNTGNVHGLTYTAGVSPEYYS